MTGGGKADAIVKLCEELVDGCGRVPGRGHAEGVGVQLSLSDCAPGGPEMSENLEACDAAESEFGIGEFAEIVGGNREEDLIAQRLVGLLIGAKSELVFVEDAVDFGDLCGGGGGGVDRIDGAVDRSFEWNVAGDEKIGNGGKGQGKVTVDAVAGVGGDSGGVSVELGLSEADGGVCGRRGDGGDGRYDWVGKRGRDRGSGKSAGRFLHGGGWEEEYGSIINFY